MTPEEAEARAKERATANRETYLEAISSADASVCENIVSDDLKLSCQQTATLELAVKNNDITLCDQMASDKGKENCKTSVNNSADNTNIN